MNLKTAFTSGNGYKHYFIGISMVYLMLYFGMCSGFADNIFEQTARRFIPCFITYCAMWFVEWCQAKFAEAEFSKTDIGFGVLGAITGCWLHFFFPEEALLMILSFVVGLFLILWTASQIIIHRIQNDNE